MPDIWQVFSPRFSPVYQPDPVALARFRYPLREQPHELRISSPLFSYPIHVKDFDFTALSKPMLDDRYGLCYLSGEYFRKETPC